MSLLTVLYCMGYSSNVWYGTFPIILTWHCSNASYCSSTLQYGMATRTTIHSYFSTAQIPIDCNEIGAHSLSLFTAYCTCFCIAQTLYSIILSYFCATIYSWQNHFAHQNTTSTYWTTAPYYTAIIQFPPLLTCCQTGHPPHLRIWCDFVFHQLKAPPLQNCYWIVLYNIYCTVLYSTEALLGKSFSTCCPTENIAPIYYSYSTVL